MGPFLYAGPVFAGLLDWLIWGRLPDALFVVGAIMVVAAATLALRLAAPPAPVPRPDRTLPEAASVRRRTPGAWAAYGAICM